MAKQYNEIRDLLNTRKLDGLFGKGVSEEQIRVCEMELHIRFPCSYRLFLEEFGWGAFGSIDLCGLGSDIPEEAVHGVDLFYIVNDERQGPMRFPNEVIPFCQNGAGDWYAFDCRQVNGNESPVVFVAHEQAVSGEFPAEKCAESFADWIFERLSDNK